MKVNPFYILLITLVYMQVARGQEENHLFLFDGQFQRTNPSILGLKQESYLGLLIDSQWLGIKDAPKQQSIFYDSYKDTQNINHRWGYSKSLKVWRAKYSAASSKLLSVSVKSGNIYSPWFSVSR